MWTEAALLAVGCTLFVNMGLADAVQETIGFRSRILSCVKCCVFWCSLAFLAIRGCRIVAAVPASFIFSYLALWLDLGLSALNRRYNELYEQIAAEEPRRAAKGRKRAKKGRARMPSVQQKR